MQRKSSARQKAVTDAQKGALAQLPARAAKDKPAPVAVDPPSIRRASGEMTLGGHVDRGLTLAALYDTGVLERLRLEVRMRLIADLTQSLAWLHANPRLMSAQRHLLIAPSTIVIGLDGVARVDVRAAKKQTERRPSEADYIAPEVLSEDPAADLRADIYSLGVLGWEALAGQRISTAESWPSPDGSRALDAGEPPDVPPALTGTREREPLRRRPQPRLPIKASPRRSGVPPLSLPEDGEWATGFAELVLQAMSPLVGDRPPDCRLLLSELEHIIPHLATTQEIAEVVQGISAVDTLCVPEPTLPDVDAVCQDVGVGLGFMDRQPCSDGAMESCAQRLVPVVRRVVEPVTVPKPAALPPPLPEEEAEVSRTVQRLREMSTGSSGRAWFFAGLLWLAVLGSLAGYAASLLKMH